MARDVRLERIEDKQERLLELLTEISTKFEGMPQRMRDLEEHRARTDGFMGGAKWAFGLLVLAVTAGFIKLGLGDVVANNTHNVVSK